MHTRSIPRSLAVALLILTVWATSFSPPVATTEHHGVLGVAEAHAAPISWKSARKHVGKTRSVKGPVKSTKYAKSSKGRPTFLNVGKAYPKKPRFTVVIWGKYRSRWSTKPEKMYKGKTIIVRGKIRMYRGQPEVFVTSPKQIKIVK